MKSLHVMQCLQLSLVLQEGHAMIEAAPGKDCRTLLALNMGLLRCCRKESQAAANKADKATLELQKIQGENEVALQAGHNLDKQDAALKVSYKLSMPMSPHVIILTSDISAQTSSHRHFSKISS